MGIIMLDINGLKQINKSYGFVKGDDAIRTTAKILRTLFQKDKVFRLDGDELAIICCNITKQELAERLQEAKHEFNKINDFSVCFGYTWSNENIDIRRMLTYVEEMILINKKEYYENSQSVLKNQYSHKLKKLLNSIKNNEFVVYLQPQIDSETEKIISAEALVRYKNAEYGIVTPDKFIGVLEKDKIISYLDLFIFEEVCKMLTVWSSAGHALIPISINFSRETIMYEGIINNILDICNKYNIKREYINIELTESIGDIEGEIIADITNKIREIGFKIILDDFGSEYTNLSLLTVMNFDEV